MVVIGLSGFAGSGKSTIAEYLVRQHGFTRLSFATAVKDITAATFGWERTRLEGATPQDRIWREEPDPFWSSRMGRPFSPRVALQYIGTDVFRTHVLPSIWYDIVISKIQNLGPTAKVVVDDVRFVNERTALREVGAHFLLVRRNTFPSSLHEALWNAAHAHQALENTDTLHQSEWNWLEDSTIVNDPVIINSGSYDDLYRAVDAWHDAWYN